MDYEGEINLIAFSEDMTGLADEGREWTALDFGKVCDLVPTTSSSFQIDTGK